MEVTSNSAQNAVTSRKPSLPVVNPMIMPTPQYFLSVCIDLYLYLDHAHSNDHYCFSILVLFLLFSAFLLTTFEEFSSEQKILDSPVHTLWINITAENLLCLEFLLEIPQYYLQFFPHLWIYDIIN